MTETVAAPGVTGEPDDVDGLAVAAFVAEYGAPHLRLPPVAIVIAAYNEEAGIGEVLDALPATACGLATAVVVVVDGSADDTARVARKHGALVCDVPVNRGQGAALRLGYRIARAGGAHYIVTTDADGQYDAAEIDHLLRPVVAGEADFVTGSRRLGREETDDAFRSLGVRVFAWLVTALTGQRITDTSFGMRVMRSEVTAEVELRQPQYQSSELLIGVIARGYRVAERPASMLCRTAGESKKGNNVLYGVRYAGVVIRTWWRERRKRAR
jgi:glycosyltransferase involved in cell wall biosynthesis